MPDVAISWYNVSTLYNASEMQKRPTGRFPRAFGAINCPTNGKFHLQGENRGLHFVGEYGKIKY